MRAEAGDQKHAVALADGEGMQRPRVRPAPIVEVDSRIAEGPWQAGGARRGEDRPAAVVPDRIVMCGVCAPGLMPHQVLDHLFLIDRRKLHQIVDGLDVVGDQALPVEPAAIEITVFVQEGHRSRVSRYWRRVASFRSVAIVRLSPAASR